MVATDESTFVTKSLLDSIVVENSQGNAGLPNPSGTDESNWTKAFSEMDDLLD